MATAPSMQHRHFVFIANVIARLPKGEVHMTRDFVANVFAEALRATNTQFSRDRFLDAARGTPCGRDKARGG